MDESAPVSVRKFQPQDREAVRRICCETAFQDIERKRIWRDDEVLADSLTLYYTDYEPESCFVAVAGNAVVGYIIGTKNVATMGHKSSWMVMPRILWKAFVRGVFFHLVNLRFIGEGIKSACKGELRTPSFAKEFPGMLHINLAGGFRRQGIGEKLIATYLAYLVSEHVKGVHFGTLSEEAKRFFTAMGFTLLFTNRRSYFKPYTDREVRFYVFGKAL